MTIPAIRHIALLLLLLYSMGICADEHGVYLEVAGSLYNPDWEFRENASGLRLSGAWMPRDYLRVRASYNTTDTGFVDLPIREVRGLPFGNWRELGLAYLRPISPHTRLEAEFSYQGLELYDKIESGPALTLGIQHSFNPRVKSSLRFGWFDIEGSDTRLIGEILTTLRPGIELVTRIDDTANFDFTWYEVGLRFSF